MTFDSGPADPTGQPPTPPPTPPSSDAPAAPLTPPPVPPSVTPPGPPPAPSAPVAPTQPRAPQATQPAEPGWWLATDGWWYPPEAASGGTVVQPGAGGGHGEPKSRMTAGLLGIFLGGFGVHRFYLGYTNIAIIQIVVTILTCGLGALWGVIEGILILVENPSFATDADGVPLVK